MSGVNLSAEDLSRMTPEEQAEWKALEEGDDTPVEPAEDDDTGDDDDETEETDEAEASVEPEPEEGDTPVSPEIEEEPKADDKVAVPDGVPEVAFIPKFSGELLPEFQEQMDSLNAKYEEGDLPLADMLKETRKIEAASRNKETNAQLWEAEQATFFKYNPEFKPEKNRILFGAMNQEVIRLANSQEAAGLTGIQILYAARDSVNNALGLMKKPVEQSKPQEKAKPKAQRPEIKTLGGVPAADSDGDVGVGKFAHLDKLNGLQLEAAVAKMTPAEQQEWLRG